MTSARKTWRAGWHTRSKPGARCRRPGCACFNSEWSFDSQEILFPTDLIYIVASESVLMVVPNVAAQSANLVRSEDRSRYAVQVNGGWAARHGVGPGTAVRFDNFLP